MRREGLLHKVESRAMGQQRIWPLEVDVSDSQLVPVVVTKVNPSPKKTRGGSRSRGEFKPRQRQSRSSSTREKVYPNLLEEHGSIESPACRLDALTDTIEGSMIITPSHASLSASHKSPTSRSVESMSVG